MLLRTLLLLLLLFLLARFIWRLLMGVMQGMASTPSSGASGGSRAATPAAVKMVKDPVCGTYVVPGKALELARGRDTLYFCSERCRDQWVASK